MLIVPLQRLARHTPLVEHTRRDHGLFGLWLFAPWHSEYMKRIEDGYYNNCEDSRSSRDRTSEHDAPRHETLRPVTHRINTKNIFRILPRPPFTNRYTGPRPDYSSTLRTPSPTIHIYNLS